MITIARIREYLNASPFKPFRIHLSDDSHHDVPHPEFAWVIGSRVLVAKIVRARGADDPEIKELATLHITLIEPLAKTRTRK
jgi:hypothetical protein